MEGTKRNSDFTYIDDRITKKAKIDTESINFANKDTQTLWNTSITNICETKLEERTTHANIVPVIINSGELLVDQKEKIYDVIAHCSFVTLLNPNDAFDQDKKDTTIDEAKYHSTVSGIIINDTSGTPILSDKEKNLLINDEEKFLTEKIKNIYKKAEIVFVPKSLYQLLIYYANLDGLLAYYTKKTEEIGEAVVAYHQICRGPKKEVIFYPKIKEATINKKTIKIFTTKKTTEKFFTEKVPEASREYNISDVAREQFWISNNKIIEILQQTYNLFVEKYLSVPNLEKTIDFIFKKICSTIKSLEKIKDADGDYYNIFEHNPTELSDEENNFIKEMIVSEYQAPKDKYRIYRGEDPNHCFIDEEKSYTSTSCSDGMFAGIINDYDTGSAYAISKKPLRNLTCIDIPKGFLINAPQKQYFFIPPVLSIGSTTGLGEYHHIRSKLAKGLPLPKQKKYKGFARSVPSEERTPWLYADKEVVDNVQKESKKEIITVESLSAKKYNISLSGVKNKITHISLHDKSD